MSKGRTLVCSNINNSYSGLKQVLDRSEYNENEDTIIFMGDYVDYHSEPLETLELLYALMIRNSRNIFLKGDHDDDLQCYMVDGIEPMHWYGSGGAVTKKAIDKLKNDEDRFDRIRSFLSKLKPFYMPPDTNDLFIHGGYRNARGPGYEIKESTLYNDVTLWSKGVSWANINKNKKEGDKDPFPRLTSLYDRIITSHVDLLNNHKKLRPCKAANVFNLNTGARGLGRISMINLNTTDFWQSDNMNEIYKN